LIVVFSDSRQLRVSMYLPRDLGEVECLSVLELGIVELIMRCGSEIVTHQG
jgi:hypothetical protein